MNTRFHNLLPVSLDFKMKFANVSITLLAFSALLGSTGCSNSSAVAHNEGEFRQDVSVGNQEDRGIGSPDETNEPQKSGKGQGLAQHTLVTKKEKEDAGDVRETSRNEAPIGDGQFSWPCWRGPNGNGISNETGLLREFPEAGPRILWRAKLGTGFSGLSVAGGRVYTLYGDGDRENVVCFDANTGRRIWKIDSDADFAQGRSFGPRSTPCVDNDRVYVVGASGMVFCLEAATGREVWSFNVYDKFKMQRFIHNEGLSCSPTIYGET